MQQAWHALVPRLPTFLPTFNDSVLADIERRRKTPRLRNACDSEDFRRRVAMPSDAHRGASGGQGGIRTPGGLAPSSAFKADALNHSATCPARECLANSAPAARCAAPSPRRSRPSMRACSMHHRQAGLHRAASASSAPRARRSTCPGPGCSPSATPAWAAARCAGPTTSSSAGASSASTSRRPTRPPPRAISTPTTWARSPSSPRRRAGWWSGSA